MARGSETEAMANLARNFTRVALREFVSNLVWSYWPIWGAPIVIGALSWVQGRTLDVVVGAALVAFAFIAWGLNNLSQWRAARTPADKVLIAHPSVGLAHNDMQDRQKLTGIRLGIYAKNRAQFPLEISIDQLDTQVGDRIPSEQFYQRSLRAASAEVAHFTNGLIDLSQLSTTNSALLCRVRATISYGHTGNRKYNDTKQYYIALKLDEHSEVVSVDISHSEIAIS